VEASLAAVLTSIGALAAGIGSVISAVVGQHKAADEAIEQCRKDLIAARTEAEKFSAELHAIKMERDGL
jgi:hypothetical protein